MLNVSYIHALDCAEALFDNFMSCKGTVVDTVVSPALPNTVEERATICVLLLRDFV